MSKPIRFPEETSRLFSYILTTLAGYEHVGKYQLWRIENNARELSARYGEIHRKYHTIDHIFECLEILDALGLAIGQMKRVALALIYHDVIYDVDRNDNEERSADLLALHLREAGFPARIIDPHRGLILATKHTGKVLIDPLARVIVDIDLVSLGREPNLYHANTQAIRFEYSHMRGFTEERWVSGRTAFLESMLMRTHIYCTPEFRRKYDEQARKNLKNELERLKKWGPKPPKRIL